MFACAPYEFCHIKLRSLSSVSAFDSTKPVPVSVSIDMPRGRSYSVGSTLSILCNVTGEPTPEVSWYKDNQALEASNNIEIPGELDCDKLENIEIDSNIPILRLR